MGNFADIDWSSGLKFIQVAMDLSGGNALTIKKLQGLPLSIATPIETGAVTGSTEGDGLYI